ncbi:hypothetical protein AVEN_211290-1 [Araneus ventricosus]|uniref:Uncharacterized protein n=1 Tax=Araneus ventricosus TaxID=182803 RepID=A0A4Y2HNI6_ARAVE|nr:hypothetical protein AVEN_211290-1 [Araneus ventricosus]
MGQFLCPPLRRPVGRSLSKARRPERVKILLVWPFAQLPNLNEAFQCKTITRTCFNDYPHCKRLPQCNLRVRSRFYFHIHRQDLLQHFLSVNVKVETAAVSQVTFALRYLISPKLIIMTLPHKKATLE